MLQKPLPIAVLISGGGSTLKNLIDRQQSGALAIDIRLVISSRASAGGLKFARDAGIKNLTLSKKSFQTPEAYRDANFEAIRAENVSMVVMGGFLQHLLIPEDFDKRVINIHPSLIPAFSGKGFYGLKVHQAAIDFGVKISGCTVHYVDNQYDHGPIILQQACPVMPSDTAETLQQRVLELEREALPKAIGIFTEGGYRS
ncbi:MAG: phosphoribosylglycinamide formyltransferase [Planctomycetota bacterium]|nr:phosphoribosylglycinamide formyltransferase [Planctomycetota bacterium]